MRQEQQTAMSLGTRSGRDTNQANEEQAHPPMPRTFEPRYGVVDFARMVEDPRTAAVQSMMLSADTRKW